MSKNYCKIGKCWCKNCSHYGCKYKLNQPSLSSIIPLNSLNTCPKRNNNRTISFKELIINSSFDDIMNAMYIHHSEEQKNINGYKQAFYIIKNMKPVKPSVNMYIKLNTVIDEYSDEHIEYINVSGVVKGRNIKYAIDLMDWSNILYMNIHSDTLKAFNKNLIVAEILWEITFNGYSPDDVTSFRINLKNVFKDTFKN